jgi:hypothetical protein
MDLRTAFGREVFRAGWIKDSNGLESFRHLLLRAGQPHATLCRARNVNRRVVSPRKQPVSKSGLIPMRRLFVIALTLVSQFAQAAGPTENSTIIRASASGSDGKWWKCGAEPLTRCESGPLDQLGLTQEELDYVRGTLDRIPWHPQKASEEQVAAIIGSTPKRTRASQMFVGAGPGTSPFRGISVYYDMGYVSMIHWFQADRFLLVRRHPDMQ